MKPINKPIPLLPLLPLLLLLLTLPLSASAKPGYKFTLHIDGCTDSSILLCYYQLKDRYVVDTAWNNGRGKFVFKGDKELPEGLYFFTNNSGRFVDFVVYHEKQDFTFRTDQHNWTANMSVKGSRQNEVFFNYQRASERLYRETVEAQKSMDSLSFVAYRARVVARMDSLKAALYLEHPESMAARMIRATTVVEDEVPLNHPDGTPLSRQERFRYLMAHYLDYIPLGEDFIIRTPQDIFYRRYTNYTDKYMQGMPPEDICPLLDTLIDRAETAPTLYRWLINTLTEKYLQSNIMVYDEVYVHLVQRYFATGKATWLTPSTIDMNVERATKWERLLVGREAPELILFDTLRRVHSLHHMPGKYTLLLFWSPTCGHCREVIPAIYRAFDEVADSLDITAFAILTEPDENTQAKWKRFLADHNMTNPRWVNLSGGEANVDWREVYDIETTPQIYLIGNKEHRFLAKKLNADLFRQICQTLK